MTVKVRFAPSPTGLLHVGNARTAVIVWLFARAMRGEVLLRMDDTDLERSTDEFAQAIQEDLQWLGLQWDTYARQRERLDIYETQIQKLKDAGRLYPCYETADELGLKRKALLSQGLPPIYDRGALKLTAEQKAKYEAEGRRPHWRFLLDHKPIAWEDLVRGPTKFEGKDLSDPVLIREDGSPLYHLCSVIDDIDLGITHIIRGEDHVTNSAAHIQMFEALGAHPPALAHLPLISDAEGGKLSKRLGALSIRSLRDEEHLEPMSIISLLGRLGTSLPIEPFQSFEDMAATFGFDKFSRSTPKFDPDEIYRLNAKILHGTPFSVVKDRLEDLGMHGATESFWTIVRANISKLDEALEWWRVAQGPVTPQIDEPAFLEQAASLLPAEPWTSETWKLWTTAVKDATGRKGKELFMPLRRALTGMDHGPELGDLLPLIGHDMARHRLLHGK